MRAGAERTLTCQPTWLFGFALYVLAAPIPADAQTHEGVPTVGVLTPQSATSVTNAKANEALKAGLKELGWIPGHTIRLEYRYPEFSQNRLPALARELVERRVDVIVARATSSVQVAKQATSSIPIVMSGVGLDPIEQRLVATLGRPGGRSLK